MALIVQKYGGTSVGTTDRLKAVAARVAKTASQGDRVVVVVSAMGKSTDTLVKLAGEISAKPSRREMDMLLSTGEQVSIALLSMALHELGQDAISMTGAQVGIVTEAAYSRARILEIQTDRLDRHLNEGKVVVVAGFQGISTDEPSEITTLGRGGSDTSAVALAAALKADRCEIYTDVPGILSADPRACPDARLMTEITSDEMLELANLGAKVLHPRAVEIARNYGIPLVVRSSWTDEPGTRVVSGVPVTRPLRGLELVHPVDAVKLEGDRAKVSLLRVPDCPGVAEKLFAAIASENIDVDAIVQSIHDGNTNDIAFTVRRADRDRACAVAEALAPNLGNVGSISSTAEVLTDSSIAQISIVGAGMVGQAGVAARMFSTLAAAGVNIQMITTSEVKIGCLIAAEDGDRAAAALCQAFETTLVTEDAIADSIADLPVRGVALDSQQARLVLRQVPDRPGMAAHLFQALADDGISVDTIVQSERSQPIDGILRRDIAFTVARADAEAARQILSPLVRELGCSDAIAIQNVAKVSAVGAGMAGHPGVAARMFEALADRQINIQSISTSDIKISCVIDSDRAIEALQAVHQAFGLGVGGLGV